MKSTNLLALFALVLALAFAAEARAGLITYTFADYPSAQNGYTITGTITTDGMIGTLSSADITAWSFSATDGITTLSIASTDAGAQALVGGVNSATATSIVLGDPFSSKNGGHITIENSTTSYELIANDGGQFSNHVSTASGPGGLAWNGSASNDSHQIGYAGNGAPASSPDTAAPEPSTLVIFGSGLLGLVGYRWRRRYQK